MFLPGKTRWGRQRKSLGLLTYPSSLPLVPSLVHRSPFVSVFVSGGFARSQFCRLELTELESSEVPDLELAEPLDIPSFWGLEFQSSEVPRIQEGKFGLKRFLRNIKAFGRFCLVLSSKKVPEFVITGSPVTMGGKAIA